MLRTCDPVVDIVARPQEFSGQHLQSTLENLQILNEEQRTAVKKLLNEFQELFSTCALMSVRCNRPNIELIQVTIPIKETQDVCLLQGKGRSKNI
ncbi:hypothetical protein AVEN_83519-1 [Araneus ventricosus]|uniref:Uncharacterized protein n=1 Tax=Araneus ventricosus TaxID=182803 RepID=A0A4Y2TRR1_ARAVE|nr:hypothetical protein AVEN_83519-1 [Araneus ventricosus]